MADHRIARTGSHLSRRSFVVGTGAAALAATGAATLTACSAGDSGGSGASDKTLNLMLASWVDADFIEQVLQEAAAGPLDVKLNLMTVDDGAYPAQALAAQESGEVPDLIFWTAQGIPTLLASGVNLADISDYAQSEDKAAFYEQNYQASTVGDKLYGLGFRCQSRGIVYRQDFADAAGVTAKDAWNFDEFGEFVAALRDGNRIGFGYEAKVGDGRASSNFLPLFWSTGASLVTGDAGSFQTGFTEDHMATVLQFYADAVHEWESTPTDVANWGYQETDGNFAKGALASYSAGPFVFQQVQQYPETLENLAVAPIPNAGTQTSFWEEHTLMVHADSPRRDLALKFLENMRSVETQTTIAAREGDAQLSVRQAVNETEINNEVLKGFGALLEDAVVPEPINIAPIMNDVMLPAIGSVALASSDVATAATKAMEDMATTLDQINKA